MNILPKDWNNSETLVILILLCVVLCHTFPTKVIQISPPVYKGDNDPNLLYVEIGK